MVTKLVADCVCFVFFCGNHLINQLVCVFSSRVDIIWGHMGNTGNKIYIYINIYIYIIYLHTWKKWKTYETWGIYVEIYSHQRWWAAQDQKFTETCVVIDKLETRGEMTRMTRMTVEGRCIPPWFRWKSHGKVMGNPWFLLSFLP